MSRFQTIAYSALITLRNTRAPRSEAIRLNPISSCTRLLATTSICRSSNVSKSSSSKVAVVAKLRKTTECSISKAREAMAATDGSYEESLKWIEEDAAKSGAKKAAKVGDRIAAEGIIALSEKSKDEKLNNLMDSFVEINCETDFAARNPLFVKLAQDISYTSKFFADQLEKDQLIKEIPLEFLLNAPLMSFNQINKLETEISSVSDSILQIIGKLGENIKLRRALIIDTSSLNDISFIGTYAHSSDSSIKNAGKIVGTVILSIKPKDNNTKIEINDECKKELKNLSNKIAQQITGFNPLYIKESDMKESEITKLLDPNESKQDLLNRIVLLNQNYLFGNGETIEQTIKTIGDKYNVIITVNDMKRWECGEGIEKKQDDFAEEVRRQAGL